jgi:two-component system, NtrC family, nitrogen regulation sensor histidine kinase NtrY
MEKIATHIYPNFMAWIRRNSTLILITAATLTAIFTYAVISGHAATLDIKTKRFWFLLIVNLALLVLLMVTVGRRIFGLWAALRSKTAGSKLQKRILILFSVVAITPTLIVSIFSALFFNLGIETWFNERVQTAVEESLAVAEAYLDEHKENLRADALAMAGDLNQYTYLALSNPQEFNRMVAAQSALRVLTESIVFRDNLIIAQGRLSFAIAFERISPDLLERAQKGEVVILPTEDDKVRALVKLDSLNDTYLIVGRLIDSKVIAHMRNAQGAVSEYGTLATQLDRLQIIFSIVFITLAMLLLFCSLGYGMIFATRLTNPISKLVGAAERVRGGDFSARVTDVEGVDDIGTLARSFNRMTEQLEAQRGELIEANRRLDERRRFSEAVLSGVSAGVIALNREKAVTLVNRSSLHILSAIDQSAPPGAPIGDVLPGIQELLLRAEHLPGEVVEGAITVNKNNNTLTLHVRITVEKLGQEIEGFIVTFDDITKLVSAQRTAAWADVARRVAHEIKNPLTPIQLAAERLKRKYAKYIHDDQENFIRYTDTIAKQVGDIGRIVEEFVSFARMPTPVFSDEELNAIVKKSVFSAQVSNPSIEYRMALPDKPVLFRCDERQITQVLMNLLKNAGEAIEARREQKPGEIKKGHIAVRLACEKDQIILAVEDNGIGFPAGDIKKMLEPYVTTRSKGTGLGLAIVRKIVEEHKGKITLENAPEKGAIVSLYFSATV